MNNLSIFRLKLPKTMFYSFFNSLIKGYLKYRHARIQNIYLTPFELQKEVLTQLINKLKSTKYGKENQADLITDITSFQKYLPIVTYEDLFPYIDEMMKGNEDILWPGKANWFAKSSGTTNDRSKYIPITDDNLFENHVAASWDAMSILYNNRPDALIFDRKNLIMGGSLSDQNKFPITGDISAILLSRMPSIGRPFYSPDFETALLSDWEEKIEKMAQQCSKADIVMFAGVPTWTIVLFKRILQITGKQNMLQVWPNLKTYFHGGVGFDPYVEQFKEFLPSDDIEYYEVYNASEGYFAVQDRLDQKGMLLLLDNAIFYEFIPLEKIGTLNPIALTLEEVELGVNYCIVITSSSGLWRYMPGDVVTFVTISPFRIMVTGRTKHYINVFGEEVMVSNTDTAISTTCHLLDCKINDYTVGPIFLDSKCKGGHEWMIEFEVSPKDLAEFEKQLDKQLRSINSDYDAKRHKDIALQNLKIISIPKGSFNEWLRSKGKIGGQSKIPRLCNDRRYLEEFLKYLNLTE